MANPTTNYGFVLPTPTDLVTDLPADFDVALQGVDTQMLTNANAAIGKTIVDAKGDIIAATAADAVSRLAVGANDTILTADSTTATGLKWAAPAASTIGCSLFQQGVSFAYTSGAQAALPFANEAFDSQNYHSTSTNTSRITIPSGRGGNYRITGSTQMVTAVGVNYVALRLLKNGSLFTSDGMENSTITRTPGGYFNLNGSVVVALIAGDYLELAYASDASTATYTLYAQFGAVLIP